MARVQGPTITARVQGPAVTARVRGPTVMARVQGPAIMARVCLDAIKGQPAPVATINRVIQYATAVEWFVSKSLLPEFADAPFGIRDGFEKLSRIHEQLLHK